MKRLFAIVATLFASVAAVAQTAPTSRPVTRVACVGDSITLGVGVKDMKADSYPSVLQTLLGDGFEVRNFGESGATALAHSNRPYVERKKFKTALEYKADVVVVMLGTNDSKRTPPTPQQYPVPDNWARKADFAGDYAAMLAAFRAANPDVKLYVATPVPVYRDGLGGITAEVVRDEVVPLVREVAKANDATLIETHEALKDQPEKFPDNVHPNEAGARKIAETVHAAIAGAATPSRP